MPLVTALTRTGKRLAFSTEAKARLLAHDWPGNVCELENVIERACALDWGSKLTASMIEPWLTPRDVTEEEADGLPGLTLAEMAAKTGLVDELQDLLKEIELLPPC